MNALLLNALRCKNTGRAPVWLMRQAGRYMPDYRALRQKHSFLEMCHEPELIAKVTLLPIHSFGMDAAILFSDILMIPEALQVGLHFEDKLGPLIDRPLSTVADVQALPKIDVGQSLKFVAEGIKCVKEQLTVPLLGFCGAPFTVASYMIEGKSSRDLRKTKKWMLTDPAGFHQLLSLLTELSIDYLKLQIQAGVAAVQVFDSWANVLSPEQFREFSLPYLKRIVDAIRPLDVPVILFGRGFSSHLPEVVALSPDAISIDWCADLKRLRQSVPTSIALQGNLDPDILHAPQAKLQSEVNRLLDAMHGDQGYVFNLGHGIHPETPFENVRTLVETVQRRG